MLKKMVVRNFKCFKNECVFDFRKTDYNILKRNTHESLLKGALFVGDNASGKTTAIQPIKLLLDLLFLDQDIILAPYMCLFSQDRTVCLEYEFNIDGSDIEYSFSFGERGFIDEILKVDGRIILKRNKNNANLQLEGDGIFYGIDDSILFLKRVYFNTKFDGNKILLNWFDFLKKSKYIDAYSREIWQYNHNQEEVWLNKYVKEQGIDNLNEFFMKYNFKYSLHYVDIKQDKGTFEDTDEDKKIFFEHQGIDTFIPFQKESLGNKTLLNILPAILSTVKNGGMLIIDEFSSGLHNKLEELLVKYIMEKGKMTQLFFVSHSTNLLSNSILRPDQIYAVERAGKDGSQLYRFSDEHPRAAQNLEKMYLSGVFGGVPEYENNKE